MSSSERDEPVSGHEIRCSCGQLVSKAAIDAVLAKRKSSTLTPKWDTSGLKEACQRGLAIGRTHQEFDLQLLLDMLLEIERLESDAGNSHAATRMRNRCVEKLKSIAADYRKLRKDNANIIAHHLDGAANQLQSLTLEGEQEEQEKL